ncbi:MAG: SGNH/GDSL hydrolase family protein [Leptospirales bacterium]|nr:SGNH/GDSL hydrolase family protein [Leptospirales bacterium]
MNINNTLNKLKSGEKVKLVALGDSLTYGWMTQYGFLDYLEILVNKKYLNSQLLIINKGVPGDTAADGLHRVERDVIKLFPDLVFIQFALNDAYSGLSANEFQKNIESIIGKIKERLDPEIALLTSVAIQDNSMNRVANEFYMKISQSGEKYKLPVISVHEYWEKKIASGIKHSQLVQYDGVHPTEKGYELMAEAVFELF